MGFAPRLQYLLKRLLIVTAVSSAIGTFSINTLLD